MVADWLLIAAVVVLVVLFYYVIADFIDTLIEYWREWRDASPRS